MSKHSRTKLVPLKMEPENPPLQVNEDYSPEEQNEEPTLPELDLELECPRCNGLMQLHSSFNKLMYGCENCSFLLKCV
jgi:ssDNA-binding Zn-finger/Zn-ribbon topoisomerase 1